MTASPVKLRSVREQVSEAEWQARVQVATCYRLMALYGTTDMIYNHIIACVPGKPQECRGTDGTDPTRVAPGPRVALWSGAC